MRFMLLSLVSLLTSTLIRAEEKPISPSDGPIVLFDGKSLANFYTYLDKLGKNDDPKKVFTVVREDGEPAIRVSGEVYGCFTTEKEYTNYHLKLEFKWGPKTFPPREKNTRDSGVLVHCIGEDGGHGAWMESIEYQMIEGGTGDIIVVSGKGKRPRVTATVEQRDTWRFDGKTGEYADKPHKEWYYSPKGEKREFPGGRVNWYGRDPKWKDVLGFRGEHDVEKPVGQWNSIECICDGDTMTNILNGKVVNKATNVTPMAGKILFQSEGAEVFFRKIELHPVRK